MMCDWFSCDLDCIGCRSANLVTGPSSGGSKLTCTDAESCQMECEHLNCWLEATRAEQASLIVGVGNAKLDCLGGSTCDVTGEQDLDFTVVDATATAECGAMGGSCLAACDGASDCTMKCNAADTCILSCDASGGAACLVECDTATTCDLACDGDTTLDCTGPAIKVCGRACP